jgi:hypothetical protein
MEGMHMDKKPEAEDPIESSLRRANEARARLLERNPDFLEEDRVANLVPPPIPETSKPVARTPEKKKKPLLPGARAHDLYLRKSHNDF